MSLDPYPGESLGLFEAADVTGTADFDLVLDIHYRDGSRTLGSGDVWKCWFWPLWEDSGRYLDDPGADVVVSWVIEVLSGTGTLTAAEGFDPAYDDEGVATPTSLGSVTVTGAGTYVIASSLMGAAEFADTGTIDGSFVLRLEGTSGSIEVLQVKVRAWPPGGVGGWWSDTQPSFNGSVVDSTHYSATANYIATGHYDSDPGAAWDAAKADYYAQVAAAAVPDAHAMTTTVDELGFVTQGVELFDLAPTYGGGWIGATLGHVWTGADWRDVYPIASGLVEGVDWIRPPTEVPGDTFYLVDRAGDGSTGWLNAQVTFTAGSGAGSVPGGPYVVSTTGDYAPFGGVSTFGFTTGADVGAPSVVPLNTSGGRDLLVIIGHSVAAGDGAAYPGLVERQELLDYTWGDVDPIQTYAALPAYRVWDPNGTQFRPVRQFPREDGYGSSPPRYGSQGSRISGRWGGYE